MVNNGISHTESIPVANIQPWIDDALDSIEFAIGSVDTKHGKIRAEMGHAKPFLINYMAIGNEDWQAVVQRELPGVLQRVSNELSAYQTDCQLRYDAITDADLVSIDITSSTVD